MKFYKKNFFIKNNIKILILVRLASKRLKDKAISKINNYSITEILILRLLKFIDKKSIIICTSKNQNNSFLKGLSKKHKISFFAGPEENIFQRIKLCNEKFNFKHFVRVTGDNPLTDPPSIIKMSNFHIKSKNDFTYTDSLAKGMRPEVISMKALDKAASLANDQLSSEYLTYFFLRKTFKHKKIKLKKYLNDENNISITVDYQKDLDSLKKILKDDIFKPRKKLILSLKNKKKTKENNKKIPIKTKHYDVSFKNDDQDILL